MLLILGLLPQQTSTNTATSVYKGKKYRQMERAKHGIPVKCLLQTQRNVYMCGVCTVYICMYILYSFLTEWCFSIAQY